MLTKRIIPCLDVNSGRVVKGINFLNLRDAGDPVDNAIYYDQEKADELVFLDITASHQKRKTIIEVVRKVAESVFMPFTVGGGINDIDDIRNLLKAGCDKISINTAAVKDPQLIKKASGRFGSQCIVVAIDAKRCQAPRRKMGQVHFSLTRRVNKNEPVPFFWEVYINGGRTATGKDAVKWAKQAEKLGAGEILLTSMDRDGTKDGYDIELTKAISTSVNIPVIASGGAGNLEHLYQALTKGCADAVLAASIFHYREFSVKQAKEYLAKRKVAIRL